MHAGGAGLTSGRSSLKEEHPGPARGKFVPPLVIG